MLRGGSWGDGALLVQFGGYQTPGFKSHVIGATVSFHSLPSTSPWGKGEESILGHWVIFFYVESSTLLLLTTSKTPPTMLGAQQAVEDLFHHNGVEFDELWQGLDHFFLQAEGRGGRSEGTPIPTNCRGEARSSSGLAKPLDTSLLSLPLVPRG